jgi:hypothetical protein
MTPSEKVRADVARGQARRATPSSLQSSYDKDHQRMDRVPVSHGDGCEHPAPGTDRKTRDAVTGDIVGPRYSSLRGKY